MKVALLFFSGTGITANFATEIAKGFQYHKNVVDLIRIKSDLQVDLTKYDIVGIGSQTYSFRAPRLVTRILHHQDFQKKPFFLFCTSGGMPGNTLWNLYKSVKRTGGYCLGFIDGIGITNIRSWMPKLSSPKPKFWGLNHGDCEQAQQFGNLILDRLEKIKNLSSFSKNKKWIPNFQIVTSIWSIFFTWRWEMALTVGLKHVDKSKCKMCGLCATTICPSGAITLTVSKIPKFNEWKCVGCNGCVNLCPTTAIWSIRSKNHHPYDHYNKSIINFDL
ncbi:EFR1 family ferrodoxin [Promethearchaeum syntrophicum]|uniref:EFR1 family ferrodoxin n=1 Tax=Promethearchaeum syntrophicum TaxID=2594042 RepID=A0A5B9D6Q9_9ARCH|nr:EFR1 family ferrodoxin [Candidatus Prometheoarchaeum syntrophicum]QEE14520.1 Heterodisulfide reductase subunit A-like protein [Candidatus Prometheoarchaeum syntrophicum]